MSPILHATGVLPALIRQTSPEPEHVYNQASLSLPPPRHHRPSHGHKALQIFLSLRYPTSRAHRLSFPSTPSAIAYSACACFRSPHCGQFGSPARNEAGCTSSSDGTATSGLYSASSEEAMRTTPKDGGRGDELEATTGEPLLRHLRVGCTRDRTRSYLA